MEIFILVSRYCRTWTHIYNQIARRTYCRKLYTI